MYFYPLCIELDPLPPSPRGTLFTLKKFRQTSPPSIPPAPVTLRLSTMGIIVEQKLD
jgi:hypothetical protein